jgi:hypothetical protein
MVLVIYLIADPLWDTRSRSAYECTHTLTDPYPLPPPSPPQVECVVIYLDEYVRRREALHARILGLVEDHRTRANLRFVAAGGDGTVSWVRTGGIPHADC